MTKFLGLFSALLLTGCASAAVGYEPGTTPQQRDEMHRAMHAPTIAPSTDLVTTTVSKTLPIPVDQAEDWFFARDASEVIRPVGSIPGIRATTSITPTWGRPGDRRRAELTDNGTVVEQVLDNDLPRRFHYVVWNYTSKAAKYVEYGVGEFRFEPEGTDTRVTWTYAFKPKRALYTGGVRRFVEGEYTQFMTQCLENMQANAQAYRDREGIPATP